jgi:hypothetical protein
MNSFDVLISKIFFNIILNKKYFKKQLLQSSKKYIYKRKKKHNSNKKTLKGQYSHISEKEKLYLFSSLKMSSVDTSN